MFGRITNIDLLNKIVELENKMDIFLLKNSEDNIICCDCKVKELLIYKEIKEYFEDKFRDILTNIKKIEKQDNLNVFLENYKNEILTNFEKIISKLEIIKNNEPDSSNNTNEKFDKINNQLITITNKIDLLYYENEVIKHQLLLEEEIRKCEQEIDILSSLVKKLMSN